ncbi:MAG: flagellar biosynthesis protein FlgB [Rhodobacterales bacterium]|nr:MAG: flagellar biosynthesis protein FlgB [Rhodobacterales bacterium]
MHEKLNIFSMASALARHGAARQAVIAQNIANADTPGYRARDIAEFSASYGQDHTDGLVATRPGHHFANETGFSASAREVYRPGAESPNGNNVSIENEIFAAAEAFGDHDKALAVYRTALTVLRTAASGK